MINYLRHLFTPHHTNNHRPKILHHQSIAILIVVLLGLIFVMKPIGQSYPSVLGISSNISTQDLLVLTNQRRSENGLPPLSFNAQLSNAASAKASYMFEKNFWAHVAPDGTTPWYFIKNAGYSYLYAGENLARGYNSSSDVINAWMASPTHRDNMLSSNYKEVGFAVATGNLTGSDTVLVVEEFGSKYASTPPVKTAAKPEVTSEPTVAVPAKISSAPVITLTPTLTPSTVKPSPLPTSTAQIAAAVNKPLVDTKSTKQNLSLIILIILISVLIIDAIIVERKKIERVVTHNLDHIIFFLVLLIAAIIIGGGLVL